MFELILMYSEKHKIDMWWVSRAIEEGGKPDYYGPFFLKINAQKFKDNELTSEYVAKE